MTTIRGIYFHITYVSLKSVPRKGSMYEQLLWKDVYKFTNVSVREFVVGTNKLKERSLYSSTLILRL